MFREYLISKYKRPKLRIHPAPCDWIKRSRVVIIKKPHMTASNPDANWYCVYTIPRSEKRAVSKISQLGIECYLPTHQVVRQWSDRKKKFELPLFPNYVFVKISLNRRTSVLSVKEIVKFVCCGDVPVVVKEKEIDLIKRILDKKDEVAIQDEEYFQVGVEVRVVKGDFSGIEGTVLNRCGGSRLVVRVKGILRAFSINISMGQVMVI